MAQIIQIRRDIASNWTAADPTLAQGEIGLELDAGKIKFGDGVTHWTSLPYFGATADYEIQIPFAYGDATPAVLLTAAAGKAILDISISITDTFDGVGAYLSVGDISVPDALMKDTEISVKEVGKQEVHPSVSYGSDTILYLTINAGAGATQGAGIVRITMEH